MGMGQTCRSFVFVGLSVVTDRQTDRQKDCVYKQQVIAPEGGRRDDIPPADGSSTRGGSMSVRGRVRSPHMAKLQAASVPVA